MGCILSSLAAKEALQSVFANWSPVAGFGLLAVGAFVSALAAILGLLAAVGFSAVGPVAGSFYFQSTFSIVEGLIFVCL